jgi:hypothetical protein
MLLCTTRRFSSLMVDYISSAYKQMLQKRSLDSFAEFKTSVFSHIGDLSKKEILEAVYITSRAMKSNLQEEDQSEIKSKDFMFRLSSMARKLMLKEPSLENAEMVALLCQSLSKSRCFEYTFTDKLQPFYMKCLANFQNQIQLKQLIAVTDYFYRCQGNAEVKTGERIELFSAMMQALISSPQAFNGDLHYEIYFYQMYVDLFPNDERIIALYDPICENLKFPEKADKVTVIDLLMFLSTCAKKEWRNPEALNAIVSRFRQKGWFSTNKEEAGVKVLQLRSDLDRLGCVLKEDAQSSPSSEGDEMTWFRRRDNRTGTFQPRTHLSGRKIRKMF